MIKIPFKHMQVVVRIECKDNSIWVVCKMIKAITSCLEVHVVFGLFAGNSPVPTNTLDIDMSSPPTSLWFLCASQEVPKLNLHIPKRNRENLIPNSGEAEIRMLNSLNMCLIMSTNKEKDKLYKCRTSYETHGMLTSIWPYKKKNSNTWTLHMKI